MDLLAALADGPLTLDALHVKLGRPEREALRWALDEAVEDGRVTQAGGACDADGICASGAPAVFSRVTSSVETRGRACEPAFVLRSRRAAGGGT